MRDAQTLMSGTSPDLVECPACDGMGYVFPGATVGMWCGLVPWDTALRAEPCALCEGAGLVDAHAAEEYEALEREEERP